MRGASLSGEDSTFSAHKIGGEDSGEHQGSARPLEQGQTLTQNNPGAQGRYHGNTVYEDSSPRGRYLGEREVVAEEGDHRGKNRQVQ